MLIFPAPFESYQENTLSLPPPAAVHPHPLLGEGPDLALDGGGGSGGEVQLPLLPRTLGGVREGGPGGSGISPKSTL